MKVRAREGRLHAVEVKEKSIRLLIVEDNAPDARLIQEFLAESCPGVFEFTHHTHLEHAREQLRTETFDVALVDLNLPDSTGMDTAIDLQQMAPHIPIVVLTGLHDDDLAVKMMQAGIQDYLVKGKASGEQLARVLRLAIERKRMESRLEYLAHFDALTTLPNRSLFRDRLEQAIVRATQQHAELAMLFVDLDGFKAVNDSIGHDAGDKLLQIIASRLIRALRPSDTVARLGGDEFLILLDQVTKSEDAAIVAQKVQAALVTPLVLNEIEVRISSSIGIAVYPRDGHDAEALLRNADTAMYQAKARGGATYQFYAPEMHAEAVNRLTAVNALRQALEKNEFRLRYQPVVHMESGRLVGLEALLRWQRTPDELVSPAHFIRVLEESGLIVPIGAWVLTEACRQYQAWRAEGLPAFRMKVNVSARQFWREGIADTVNDALKTSGMDPQLLTLELTENMLMENTEAFQENMRALRKLGVQISIDDFGTGYSSLAYLRRLPIDSLKIDQSFVTDIMSDPSNAAIVKAIISLAHHLNLRVTAEGVETEAEAQFLRDCGCDQGQGYLFGRPLAPQDIPAIFQTRGVHADRMERGAGAFIDSVRPPARVVDGIAALIDAAPDPIVLTDNNGSIALTNRLLTQLLGYERHELLGQSLSRILASPSEQEQTSDVGSVDHAREARALHKNGEKYG